LLSNLAALHKTLRTAATWDMTMDLEMPNKTRAVVYVPQGILRNSVEVIFKALVMQEAKPLTFLQIQADSSSSNSGNIR
jgi:hypothetical protein